MPDGDKSPAESVDKSTHSKGRVLLCEINHETFLLAPDLLTNFF